MYRRAGLKRLGGGKEAARNEISQTGAQKKKKLKIRLRTNAPLPPLRGWEQGGHGKADLFGSIGCGAVPGAHIVSHPVYGPGISADPGTRGRL